MTVLEVLATIGQIREISTNGFPGSFSERFIALITPQYSLALLTTLYTTIMIVLRIYILNASLHHSPVAGLRMLKKYSKLIEILVESAALYAATLLADVILTARGDLAQVYPSNLIPQISVRDSISFYNFHGLKWLYRVREWRPRSSSAESPSAIRDQTANGPGKVTF